MKKANQNTHLDLAFDALSHPKRRGMILTLAYRPATVGQLGEEFGLTPAAMHKHIQVLEKAGLILKRKVGRTNFVALRLRGLHEVRIWTGQFYTEWGNDEETFENYIAALSDE